MVFKSPQPPFAKVGRGGISYLHLTLIIGNFSFCIVLYRSGLPKIPQGRIMRTIAMTMKMKAKAISGLYMIPKE